MIPTSRVNNPLVLGAACALLLFAAVAPAATLTVDGSVADWGFSVADNNASTFVPGGGYTLIGQMVEDSDDLAGDGGVVGPNRGGQNYDAEMMAVAVQGSSVYVAIVSGQRPDNGLARYAPGDLQITTNAGVYGVEIGGGAGGGPGTMLVGGETGSTYTLKSNGFTLSHTAANAAQTVGSVWRDADWILDPISPQQQTQMQMDGGGTYVGDATYRFTRDASTLQHSVIELAIPFSFFSGETIQNIVWHPSCGNDELSINLSFTPVPEPASIALAAVAAAGTLPFIRRRRRVRG